MRKLHNLGLFCLLLLLALPAHSQLVNGIYYNITSLDENNRTVEIGMGTGVVYLDDIVIPEEVTLPMGLTFKVTGIGNGAFMNQVSLTSVTIPKTIKYIGNYAFSRCKGLKSIDIPESIEKIGEKAFEYCSNLESFTLSNSKTAIDFENEVFLEVPLKSVFLGRNISGYQPFYNKNTIKNVTCGTDLTYISPNMFNGCFNLESIILPYTVEEIGDGAFEGCSKLTYVSGTDIKTIGSNAFSRCINLEDIEIPNTVTTISDRAFSDCMKLRTVTIKNGPSKLHIAPTAFNNSPVSNLHLGRNLEGVSIERGTFEGLPLSNITFGSSVQDILWGTFRNCTDLENITIPENINYIGGEAFSGCSQLSQIELLPLTPPLSFKESFDDRIYKECLLIVPTGTKKEYTSAQGWNLFSILKEKYTNHLLSIGTSVGGHLEFNNSKIINGENQSFEVPEDDIINVGITPENGYEVDRIYLNDQDITNYFNFDNLIIPEITSDSYLLVTFRKKTNLLMISSSDVNGGGLRINGYPVPKTLVCENGQEVTIQYGVAQDYELTSIFIDNKDVINQAKENTISFVMDNDKSILFLYNKKKENYELSLTQADNGYSKFEVKENEKLKFNFKANEGWKINTVTFNDINVTSELDAENNYTTPAINQNSFLNVSFELETPAAVQNINANKLSVRGYNGNIIIDGTHKGESINIYDLNGLLITSEIANNFSTQIKVAGHQVYLIKIGQRTFKLSL